MADRPGALVGLSVVAASGREAEVPAEQWGSVAPLLAARRLDRPEPLASYGLDRPQARLVYRRRAGAPTAVEVGAPSFDAHLLYVRRADAAAVYLVGADAMRPLLALVGLALPPPS